MRGEPMSSITAKTEIMKINIEIDREELLLIVNALVFAIDEDWDETKGLREARETLLEDKLRPILKTTPP